MLDPLTVSTSSSYPLSLLFSLPFASLIFYSFNLCTGFSKSLPLVPLPSAHSATPLFSVRPLFRILCRNSDFHSNESECKERSTGHDYRISTLFSRGNIAKRSKFDLSKSSGETVMRKWTKVESCSETECLQLLDISIIINTHLSAN